jgi:hypothetical protein
MESYYKLMQKILSDYQFSLLKSAIGYDIIEKLEVLYHSRIPKKSMTAT